MIFRLVLAGAGDNLTAIAMDLLPFDQRKRLEISAGVQRSDRGLEFIYALSGDSSDVVIHGSKPPERTDGLWQATCFEAFISTGNSSYAELNFAPSGQWAAYQFTDYRSDMSNLDVAPPEITFADGCLVARLGLSARPGTAFNLAAVIEHKNGTRSYWALAHPAANRPDFHRRDCFIAKLP